MASLKYWLWLVSHKEINNFTALRLVDELGSPENVFFASRSEYAKLSLKSSEISALEDKSMLAATRIMENCERLSVKIMAISDSDYPERLRNIHDPPMVLYIKGTLPQIDDEPVIAMVGTRRVSAYGLNCADRLAFEIAESGATITTGLAKGIDTAAAKGALRGGGRVIGVLGCGIDVVYPSSNRLLFEDVCHYGALVSEFIPGTRPYAGNFPKRNRIISGLSVGTVVVESPAKGGSLITAARALEQGRDLFAVPGNIYAGNSVGTNGLIKEGAIPVTCGDDIVQEYIYSFPGKLRELRVTYKTEDNQETVSESVTASENGQNPLATGESGHDEVKDVLDELDGDELRVASIIGENKIHVDDIIEKSGLSAADVLAALTLLELKGYVSEESGKHFSLNTNKK